AAQGFPSYGNQIGLATGQVEEVYHPGFLAKRMELGAVIAASPADQVVRTEPESGDIVILLGGGTGRDGIGGATGSSKVHNKKSVSTAAAEVQKGNAVEERKIQRLFRNRDVCLMIKRCNDFGAGGVSVVVGERAPGLDINLDAVPKKYEGLDGTELAISESQERMAVVVAKEDVDRFIQAAKAENLNAVVVATVTDTNRMVMKWRGQTIVDLDRSVIDTAGAPHRATAFIEMPDRESLPPLAKPLDGVSRQLWRSSSLRQNIRNAWLAAMSDLACCSQRGLGERFDGSIGAATVLFPYGGRYQATPEAGMAAKLPVLPPRETSTVSLMAYGYDPRVADWSPFHGSEIAVLSSLVKIACMGGDVSKCRLSFQEFFGRCVDEKTWGYPAAALLGSIDAQLCMGTGSIGGKDSMSGTFEKLNVPHTLVSFAVTTEDVKNVTSGSFKKADDNIYMVMTPYSAESLPDWEAFKKNAAALYKRNAEGKIRAMYPVGPGGLAEAISKMAMGNRIGARIDNFPQAVTRMGVGLANETGADDLFIPVYGSIIVEADHLDPADFEIGTLVKLGVTVDSEDITLFTDIVPNITISLKDMEQAWEGTLSKVFPPVSSAASPEMPDFAFGEHESLAPARKSFSPKYSQTKPRVIIPVFPGTNCEYDMARAFSLNGADPKILVFRNRTAQELSESLDQFKKEIDEAQILSFVGGFSVGDEPDGSAKFIANVIRESRIADAIMELLKTRKGLVLGICNGFQALIKTGLVPFGEIREPSSDIPTLTYNKVGRHISRIARTRLVSATSPWALSRTVLDPRPHLVPISHGEGRVIMQENLARRLFAMGQVFSQYVDAEGQPAVSEPDNPNGSLFAIEGLTSPDGLVLGKMGHSERTVGMETGGASRDLIKNVAGDPIKNERDNSAENIFLAGVSYFA
ncbi:MAG: phosphoribosylformylglycinamidine synthase, partial [Treponema sp.]|nr:phosphoribosylformylglycinamidine synthase [Treponema sp.]